MKKLIWLLILISMASVLNAQKYVSVVESFCNTGKAGSESVIPELAAYASVADTSDENELYLQYHIPFNFSDWNDEYVNFGGEEQWLLYQSLGLADTMCTVLKNGASSSSESWFDCAPENKYIYGLAKKVSVLFQEYNEETNMLYVEVPLYTTYAESSGVNLHVLAIEDDVTVETTGGEAAGTTYNMQNVVRAVSVLPASAYSIETALQLPVDANPENIEVVAFVQDHNTGEILGGTRGISLEPYLWNTPGETFAVVENFVNSGCFGGPPAINSMSNYVDITENNEDNHALLQLHIGQIYGNWTDVYKLPLNSERYDQYSWELGIIAGLAAVAKNGIRYKEHTWNNCAPLEKIATDFVEISLNNIDGNQLTLDYQLSGWLEPHDRVYFYVVERDITVLVTGAEIPGTTLNMNNVVRAVRRKTTINPVDTVHLTLPEDILIQNARVLAYIQNDVTYEVTGGTKGFNLSTYTGGESTQDNDLWIAPNPVPSGGSFQISSSQAMRNVNLSLVDVSGRLRFHEFQSVVPQRWALEGLELEAGLYFLKLKGEGLDITKKVMVR